MVAAFEGGGRDAFEGAPGEGERFVEQGAERVRAEAGGGEGGLAIVAGRLTAHDLADPVALGAGGVDDELGDGVPAGGGRPVELRRFEVAHDRLDLLVQPGEVGVEVAQGGQHRRFRRVR